VEFALLDRFQRRARENGNGPLTIKCCDLQRSRPRNCGLLTWHGFETRFYLDDNRALYIHGGGDPFLISEELALLATDLVAATGKKPIRRELLPFEPPHPGHRGHR
jgi:hypothetical protein